MKDKLTKLNKKKTDSISVILTCRCEEAFYKWLAKRDPLRVGKVYSLKRLAKEFLAEFPGFYECYEHLDTSMDEKTRIARFNAYED